MEQKQRAVLMRIVSYLGALAVGTFIGSVTTVVNQNTLTAFGVPTPYGIILGLICVAGFLVGLRMLSEDRWLSVAGAIGFIVMVFVLSQESVGGSVLVPNNIYGTIWVFASPLVAALVLVWPRIRPRVK